jgi:hypothetical protein
LKTVGLGLSTADALAFHIGGKLSMKSLKNQQRCPIATEVEFTVLTCAKEACAGFSSSMKQLKFQKFKSHPRAFLQYSLSRFTKFSSGQNYSGTLKLSSNKNAN